MPDDFTIEFEPHTVHTHTHKRLTRQRNETRMGDLADFSWFRRFIFCNIYISYFALSVSPMRCTFCCFFSHCSYSNQFELHRKNRFRHLTHSQPYQRFIKYNWNTLSIWKCVCVFLHKKCGISSLFKSQSSYHIRWMGKYVSSNRWQYSTFKFYYLSFKFRILLSLRVALWTMSSTSSYIVCIWRLLHCFRVVESRARIYIHDIHKRVPRV